MIEAFKIMTELPDGYLELSNQIIYAMVQPSIKEYSIQGGIHYFPSETDLRMFRLGREDVIWLQELTDKNCSKCYGKGNLGVITKPVPTSTNIITRDIIKYLDSDIPLLAQNILKMMGHDPELMDLMKQLLTIAVGELTDDNLSLVAVKYAKQIKKDFPVKEIQWCTKCFRKNFTKQVIEVLNYLQLGVVN